MDGKMKRRTVVQAPAVVAAASVTRPAAAREVVGRVVPTLGDEVTVFQHPRAPWEVTPGRYRLHDITQPFMLSNVQVEALLPPAECRKRLLQAVAQLKLSTIIEVDSLDGATRMAVPRCCVRELDPVRCDVPVGDKIEITARFLDSRQFLANGDLAWGEPEHVKRVPVTVLAKKPIDLGPDEGRWLYELDLQSEYDREGRREMVTETLLAMYADEDFGATYRTTGWRRLMPVEPTR